MKFLVFNTYLEAFTANAVISLNMRLGSDSTLQYAIPRQRMDLKWALPKPEEQQYMEYVIGYTEEDNNNSWFEEIEELHQN